MNENQNTHQSINIANEGQAIELLRKALEDQFENENVRLNFKDWPRLRLEYKGEKFKGTITPDIAKALVELQEAMERVYMQAVHGTTSRVGLDQSEKRALELVATVEEGSSLIDVNLGNFAEKLAAEMVGKMSSTEIIIAVIGVSVVFTAGWAWKSHLKNRSEEKQLQLENESRLQLSQQETERLRIVTDAMRRSPVVQTADKLVEEPRNAFIKSATEADTFTIQGGVSITGEEARQIYRAARISSQEVQLNGAYFIEGFQWTSDGETARVNLHNKDDGKKFMADLSVNALSADQKTRFKDSTFDRLEVYLSINGTVLHDKVTSARIVSVTEQPKNY